MRGTRVRFHACSYLHSGEKALEFLCESELVSCCIRFDGNARLFASTWNTGLAAGSSPANKMCSFIDILEASGFVCEGASLRSFVESSAEKTLGVRKAEMSLCVEYYRLILDIVA